MATESLRATFTDYAEKRLADCLWNITRCVRLMTPEQVWQRPNEVSNSVGNLVLHLTGNVRQWILCGLAGELDQRDRPTEFSQREPLESDLILANLDEVVQQACDAIENVTEEALEARLEIQGNHVSGLTAIFHVVEHFSLHTGQIVYATKLHLNRDLSLYDGEGHRIDGPTSGAP